MKDEENKKEVKVKSKICTRGGCSEGAVYGLGMIGAFIYYIQNSQTFMEGFAGLLKAIVWPAFLIYKVYNLLGM